MLIFNKVDHITHLGKRNGDDQTKINTINIIDLMFVRFCSFKRPGSSDVFKKKLDFKTSLARFSYDRIKEHFSNAAVFRYLIKYHNNSLY